MRLFNSFNVLFLKIISIQGVSWNAVKFGIYEDNRSNERKGGNKKPLMKRLEMKEGEAENFRNFSKKILDNEINMNKLMMVAREEAQSATFDTILKLNQDMEQVDIPLKIVVSKANADLEVLDDDKKKQGSYLIVRAIKGIVTMPGKLVIWYWKMVSNVACQVNVVALNDWRKSLI